MAFLLSLNVPKKFVIQRRESSESVHISKNNRKCYLPLNPAGSKPVFPQDLKQHETLLRIILVKKMFVSPSENKIWKWVLQVHVRGRSAHGDLRLQITPDVLSGITLNWIKGLKKAPKDLDDARRMIEKRLPEAFKELLDPNIKIVSEIKQPEPGEWLEVEGWFPLATIGATRFLPGCMIITDQGICEWGTQKPYFKEYWLWGKYLRGRFITRLLPNVWRKKSLATGEISKTGQGHTVWMSTFVDPDPPYVLSQRAYRKWYPPEGKSCLPKYIRNQIKPIFRYWKKKGKEAKHVRDALIEAIRLKEVRIKF